MGGGCSLVGVCVLEWLDGVGGGDTEMGVVCLGVSCVHFACGCCICL